MALFALVASVALAAPAQSAAKCRALLKVSGLPNHWQVPTTLLAGKSSTGITIGETISEVQPDKELSDQMNALAPDFAQAVQAHYHGSPTVEQSYGYTLAADATQDFTITVGFQSPMIVYHYHRTN
jgi:hypothetical protein